MNIKRWMVLLWLVLPLFANAESPNVVIEEAVAILDKELTERRDELETRRNRERVLVAEVIRDARATHLAVLVAPVAPVLFLPCYSSLCTNDEGIVPAPVHPAMVAVRSRLAIPQR